MPRGRPKKKSIKEIIEEKEDIFSDAPVHLPPVNSEKEELLKLHKALKELGINSIGDLENRIARAG